MRRTVYEVVYSVRPTTARLSVPSIDSSNDSSWRLSVDLLQAVASC